MRREGREGEGGEKRERGGVRREGREGEGGGKHNHEAILID